MKVIRSLLALQTPEVRSLFSEERVVGVTIGNFDGMHLGHQALFETLSGQLEAASQKAQKKSTKVLLTFHPHPRQALQELPRKESRLDSQFWFLSSFRERIEILERYDFDLYCSLPFSKKFAGQRPDYFVDNYLVDGLNASVVVVGHDWGFGKGRAGGPDDLRKKITKKGGSVCVVEPVMKDGARVGSRVVKSLLADGALEDVKSFLGRPYSALGRVVSGSGRGTPLGFPTANLHLPAKLLPKNGVYATRATVDKEIVPSVTNIGVQPTFGGGSQRVEVHLLGRRKERSDDIWNLRGKFLKIEFMEYLREEVKFENVKALASQIEKDCARARETLLE